MTINNTQRSGEVTAPSGTFTKVWFKEAGEDSALKSRKYHLSITDVGSVGYEIGEQTAEYFEIKPNIAGLFTYTANTFT